VDLATGDNYQDHWVRSGCLLGYLPCNGLLYVTPHPCGCYINAKLTGFNALAPKAQKVRNTQEQTTPRLKKGPIYNQIAKRKSPTFRKRRGLVGDLFDWPTYRHDVRRSGATESAVSTDLEVAWRANIGAKPSALVVEGDKVLIAGVDTHTVHALSAQDGKNVWEYTAGSRIDSPPTMHDGLAIFGSADGRVYCLRASDGALVWRFDAAPSHRLVTAFGQLESPWPVPGSVLVHDGKCWFAAGRSSYLDGGIHVYALDLPTGRVVHKRTIYHPDPETGRMTPEVSPNQMAGVLNDIPATDGTNVFLRQMAVSSPDTPSGQHLYTTGGYLDPSWFNRTFWQVGQARTSGLMVLGEDVAYGVELYDSRSRETVFKPGSQAYRLRCIPLIDAPRSSTGNKARKNRRQQGPRPLWEKHIGIRVTAMIRAADTIFVAGSPDVVDPKDPHGAWEGRKGGVLAAFATDDGRKLAEYKLVTSPIWDGMAVARGRLFISTCDGNIVCMKKRQ
jgi:outer membrane protein assembly factor BamB